MGVPYGVAHFQTHPKTFFGFYCVALQEARIDTGIFREIWQGLWEYWTNGHMLQDHGYFPEVVRTRRDNHAPNCPQETWASKNNGHEERWVYIFNIFTTQIRDLNIQNRGSKHLAEITSCIIIQLENKTCFWFRIMMVSAMIYPLLYKVVPHS